MKIHVDGKNKYYVGDFRGVFHLFSLLPRDTKVQKSTGELATNYRDARKSIRAVADAAATAEEDFIEGNELKVSILPEYHIGLPTLINVRRGFHC